MNDIRRELLQDQYDALLAEHEAVKRERDLMRAAIREADELITSSHAWNHVVTQLGIHSDAPLVELGDGYEMDDRDVVPRGRSMHSD